MNLSINSGLDLALAFFDPTSGLAIDPATKNQAPFDPTKHLIPMGQVAVKAATAPTGSDGKPAWTLPLGLFDSYKTAQDARVMQSCPNADAVLFRLNADGSIAAVYDVYSNPFAALGATARPAFSL